MDSYSEYTGYTGGADGYSSQEGASRGSAGSARSAGGAGGGRRRRSSTKPMPDGGQGASRAARSDYRRGSAYGYDSGRDIPASRRVQYRSQNASQYDRSAYTRAGRSDSAKARRQVGSFATAADKYKARQPQKQAEIQERIERPVTSTGMMVRVAIVVVLLLVLFVRFAVQGGVFSQVSSLNAQVSEQQTQLEQLSGENSEMQATIDSRQATIDAWNDMSS